MKDLYIYTNQLTEERRKCEEAATYFLKSGNMRSYALALRDIAKTLVFQDSLDLALDTMLKADSIIGGTDDSVGISSVKNGLGNIYRKKGSYEKATIGTILNIKPILKIEDGVVKQKTQVRGSKKIIPTLIEQLKLQVGDDFSDKEVYVGYGDDIEECNKFVEKVKNELSPKSVKIFQIGACVACHSGPDVFGLACLNK